MEQQEIKFKCLELAVQIIQNNLTQDYELTELAQKLYNFVCDIKE